MLLSLSLKNFIIVEQLELNFEQGFTVLTGETGTGKSIILNALGLLLGDKADFSQIRQGCTEAQLSALFSLSQLNLLRLDLIKQGFLTEEDDELSIRRIIDIKGRSRNFLNGQTTTLGQLKKIGEQLIDIHGQNVHYSLNTENTQRTILDTFSSCNVQSQEVSQSYQLWQEAQAKLDRALQSSQSIAAERDRLSWQLQELTQLAPQENEWEELSQNYDTLAHAADLLQSAETIENIIDNDQGLFSLLNLCQKQLNELANLNKYFTESLDIFNSIEAELTEISSNMRQVKAQIEINPDELAIQEQRMYEFNSLAKKYHIGADELPKKWQEIQLKLAELENNQDIEALNAAVTQCQINYQQAAAILTQKRTQGAKQLSKEVTALMHTLAMEKSLFSVLIKPHDKASIHGNESIQYLVSMNTGTEAKALNKIASGGELARISLAIQMATSSHTTVPTLIFDEVDTGIGGRVAEVIGQALRNLGQIYQVLVITHLPQVAAYGQYHFQVQKIEKNNQTFSYICNLNKKQQIDEIARMLGGQNITPTTLSHAEEMKKFASN